MGASIRKELSSEMKTLLCAGCALAAWFLTAGVVVGSLLPATSVASFVYLNPPFAALFGYLFFGEEVTILFLLGGAVVLTGLSLAQTRR